jgi:regulatory protein
MTSVKKYTLSEAKTKIEFWCAFQERAPYDVRQKLFELGLHAEDVDALLASLISNNYLNEQRFAEAFCSGKFHIKKWGRIKIVQHLKQKFISDYSIKKGLLEIDEETYMKTIQTLIEKKKAELRSEKNSWIKKAKIVRFLQSKGYELELIQETINNQ